MFIIFILFYRTNAYCTQTNPIRLRALGATEIQIVNSFLTIYIRHYGPVFTRFLSYRERVINLSSYIFPIEISISILFYCSLFNIHHLRFNETLYFVNIFLLEIYEYNILIHSTLPKLDIRSDCYEEGNAYPVRRRIRALYWTKFIIGLSLHFDIGSTV